MWALGAKAPGVRGAGLCLLPSGPRQRAGDACRAASSCLEAWGLFVASSLLFQVGHGLVRRRRSRARSLQVCARACHKPGPLSRASSQIWEPVLGSVRQRRLGFSVQLSCMRKARCRKAYMRSQFCKTSLDQPPKFCIYLGSCTGLHKFRGKSRTQAVLLKRVTEVGCVRMG